MKKIKFIDSICFRGEIDLLIFRLNELNDYVDKFIIADFTETHLNDSPSLFEKYGDKLIRILVSEKNYLEKIKTEFINLEPDFEDVLMISDTNEVPNLTHKDIFLDKLMFESFVLFHQNFIWNSDYIDVNPSRGTLVTNFSLFLQLRKSAEKLYDLKFVKKIYESNSMNNGWKFSNFGDYDPNYETNIKEILPPCDIDPVRTYPLIKHNNEIELPKNINLLPYFKIGRYSVKRHLFLVESDLEFVNQDYYDTITIIDFDSNLKEVLCEKVSEKITKSILYLPNVVLYGDPETFQDNYMLNETKRMFSVVFPQEEDIIEVIFKNEKPLVLGGVSN